jgi:hypothetical protein
MDVAEFLYYKKSWLRWGVHEGKKLSAASNRKKNSKKWISPLI